jgi:predicted Zn-dependent protease with MMP-like domain/Flp pilus assembly protein TadD
MRLLLPLGLAATVACTSRPAAPPPAAPARAESAAASPTGPAERGRTLDRVRPPAAPCLPGTAPGAHALLARAAAEIEAGRAAQGLACAEEALELEPRSLPALRARAAALSDLDRMDEARGAMARALAADPDDPSTLLAAADLEVSRIGDRDALEAGRDHALRGTAVLRARTRPEPAQLARLLLLAGMADNQLGRSRDALLHLDQGLRAAPQDLDLLYERGVALFELCRFASARRAFESVLRRSPEDAWSIHHLGLIAERSGDEARARTLLSRAARLAPRELRAPVEMDRAAFEAEVRRALAELPEAERAALAGVPVQVEEIPALADLTAVDPPLSPSILGLFRGPPLGEPCLPADGPTCRSVVLYRRNLLRFASDRAQVAEQLRVTLFHELGHLHGESDDALRSRGLE